MKKNHVFARNGFNLPFRSDVVIMIYEDIKRLKYYSLNFSTSLIGQEILSWEFIGDSEYLLETRTVLPVSSPTFYHKAADASVPIFSQKYNSGEDLGNIDRVRTV